MSPFRKSVFLLLLLVPAWLSAERVMVRVVDMMTGTGIPEAAAVLSGDGRREISDAGGWIQFEIFEYGIFEGAVSASGYSSRRFRLEVDPDTPDRRMEIFLSPLILDLEAFEVTAELTDEDRDLLASREAIAPMNQVSGQELQDVTTDGVSDSLERIAGVTVNTEGGAASGISIRGAGARQTRITLDGQSMAGGGGRGTTRGAGAMNQVPKEFLNRVQVMKAPTPDMDADAIGGTVDLQTSRIANSKSARSSIAARSSYQDNGGLWGHRFNAAHAQPFKLNDSGRRFGILVALNGMTSESSGDSLQVLNQWPIRQSPETGEDIRTLARFRAGGRLSSRKGFGAMLNTDLQLSKGNTFQFKVMWNESEDSSSSQFHTWDFLRGAIISLTPVSGEFRNMRLEKQFLEHEGKDSSGSVVLAGEHLLGDWQIEESIGYSFAESESLGTRNGIFQTARNILGSYDTAETPKTPQLSVSRLGTVLQPEDLLDPDPYGFYRYDLIDNWADDTELAVRLNVGRRWETASAKWIFKSGLKSRMREASQDQDKDRYLPGPTAFTLAEVAAAGPATVFKDLYANGPSWDYGLMDAYFRDNPGSFEPDESNSVLDSLASDFSVSEGIHSVYSMAQRENDDWVFVAGLRLEHTDMEAQGYETISEKDENGDPVVEVRPVSVSQDYNKLFPGLHVLHRLSPNWVLRASLTRTLQRPDFRDLSPSSRVNLDTKRIRSGNPELRPFDAKALDLGTDFLLNGYGSVSLGFFAKRIDDFIVDIEEQTDYLGEPGFTRSYPVNGTPADLLGIEAAWNTTLAFLPGLLDTTNLSLNYTWTDSTAAYPGYPGTIIMLPEQVRDVFNASLRWQYANWTFNLRTRYQGLRLNDLIEPGQDQFTEGFWSHSVSVGYKINDTMSFSLGFANLNHPDRFLYQGNPGQLVANRESSRSYSIGLNIRFGQGKIPTAPVARENARQEG